MKVKALKSFSLGHGRDVECGQVFELPDPEARLKISQGKVEPTSRPATAPEHPEAGGGQGVVTTQGASPTHRDPAPPRRSQRPRTPRPR